jgi:hypothetical protein
MSKHNCPWGTWSTRQEELLAHGVEPIQGFAGEALTEGRWYSQLQGLSLQGTGVALRTGSDTLATCSRGLGGGTAPLHPRPPGSHLFSGKREIWVIASSALVIWSSLTTHYWIRTSLLFIYRLPEKCVLSQSRTQLFCS